MNALSQVNVKNRKALKFLNTKLETLDSALQDQDEDDMVRILNSRLSQDAYVKVSVADGVANDKNGEYDFTLKSMKQLEEAVVRRSSAGNGGDAQKAKESRAPKQEKVSKVTAKKGADKSTESLIAAVKRGASELEQRKKKKAKGSW